MAAALAGGLVTMLLVTGCSEDAGDGYYGAMGEIGFFDDATDSDLDGIAESACALIETARETGMSDDQAFDHLYQSMREFGLSEADALMASLNISRFHCPVELSTARA